MDAILDVHNQKFKEMESEGVKIQNFWRTAVNNKVGIKHTCTCRYYMDKFCQCWYEEKEIENSSILECWLMGDEDKTERRAIVKKCQYEWMARHTSWDNNTVIRKRLEKGLRMVCRIRRWGKDYESRLRWWYGNDGDSESKFCQATTETETFCINSV